MLLVRRIVSNHAIRLLSTTSIFDVNHLLSKKLECQSKLKKIETGAEKAKLKKASGQDKKKAAVLVPLCVVNGVPSVLFTLRSLKMSGFQGDVSFPGGKADPGDKTLAETALRETREEIGLRSDGIELWGYMNPLPSRGGGMLVTPVIGFCGDVDLTKLHVNHHEVERVFVSSLESLCKEEHSRYTTFRTDNSTTVTYKLPLFVGQTYKIWGLTSFILYRTLRLIAPDVYKFDLSAV